MTQTRNLAAFTGLFRLEIEFNFPLSWLMKKCLELSVKREKMSCMRVIDGFDPLVCHSGMKAACEPTGIVMTYALVQPSKNLHEPENAFVAPYRIDMQMVA